MCEKVPIYNVYRRLWLGAALKTGDESKGGDRGGATTVAVVKDRTG